MGDSPKKDRAVAAELWHPLGKDGTLRALRRRELARHRPDGGRQQVAVVDQDRVLADNVGLRRLAVPGQGVLQRDVLAAFLLRGGDDEIRGRDARVEPGLLGLPEIAVRAAAGP